jgi:23S rRNA (uracil1939-C5)-methyltransferase
MAPRSHRLVSIDRCLVLGPDLDAALPAAKALAELLLASSPALDLQFTAVANGLDCDIRGMAKTADRPISALADIARQYGICRISIGGQDIVTMASPFIDIAGVDVMLPPGAFLQATTAGEHALTDFIMSRIGSSHRAVDLFCGIGTFTFPLARRLSVLAIDNDAKAVQALTLSSRKGTGLKPIEARTRNLFHEPLTSAELAGVDLLVFDPPRQGAEAQAKDIAASKCRRVIAISCNPATFARDAAILVEGGYSLVEVLPVDQFRWSAHVEIAAFFTRGSKSR